VSEPTPEAQAGPVVKVARDLREIVAMCAHLDDQAEHEANAHIDGHALPGGLAMVAMAGVANLEAWQSQYDAAEAWNAANPKRQQRPTDHIEDEDDEWEPPLQTLAFWSEQWRAEHGAEYDQRPTVASEANFIRWALDWAWDHEVRWDDFAKDIRAARVRIENVLYAGNRAERTRVVCDRADCEKPARLIRKYGFAEDGSDDWWRCPSCKTRFDADGVSKAHAHMLRSEGAERWVEQVDAIGTLKAQGRAERTIRGWLGDRAIAVQSFCDPVTHRVWVWWPDLWHKHLTTPTRKRDSA